MKMKKIICLFLCVLFTLSSFSVVAFAEGDDLESLKASFQAGVGPETDGYSIDYRYYSPVKANDKTKYPLVIWLHGMGDGEYEGKQIEKSNIAYWVSDDFQSRFKDTKGAFVLAARSVEEEGLFWTDSLIFPLRSAIDDFIAKNKKNIDVTRIYIGGYSMGGKMTLKMAVAYPEMFAAAFPICPAWTPGEEAVSQLKDMPIWLTSGVPDPLVNYFAWVTPTWNNIVANSNNKENLRFSSLSRVCYEDGRATPSSHHSWFAVNHDMFSSENGDYPYMKTVDGNGENVTLTYPDGMISWISSFESDFDGKAATDAGSAAVENSMGLFDMIINLFKNFFIYVFGLIGA